MTSTLALHYDGPLGELQESQDRQDITYLANKSGWDARAVALAALSDQFSQRATQAEIHPAFYYALFRAGLPSNEDILYQTDSDTLVGVWNQAVEQGVLTTSLAEAIPATASRFQSLSAQKRLNAPALVGSSSLKELLTTSLLDEAQQTKFSELSVAHQNDSEAFWQAVSQTFDQHTTQRLQVDGKLGFLTINNAPLMQALHNTAGEKGLADPIQLVQSGYYQTDALSNLLITTGVPIPNEIPGNTAEVKRTNYAGYIAAQLRLSYPTAQ